MIALSDTMGSPQYLNHMCDYLRFVYTRSAGLDPKQRKQLIKGCLHRKLKQDAEVVGKNVDVANLLRGLAALFGANFDGKSHFSSHLSTVDINLVRPPKRTKTVTNSENNNVFTGRKYDQSSLQQLIEMLTKSPNSTRTKISGKNKDPEQILEEIVSTFAALQKRFSKTDASLLEMLKRIDKVLVASDNSIKEATQSSFDLIINSLDPAVFGLAVDRRKYRTKKAYQGKLYEMYTEKYLQLKQYHEQGRFVKDCRAIYREKMKKYGL